MSDFSIRPLSRRGWAEVVPGSEAVDGWCWAGHDGLESGPVAPTTIVPTGWLWGWGHDRWLRWRVDPRFGCVGAELRRGTPDDGWQPATVGVNPSALRVRREPHLLTWAPTAQRATTLELIGVITPAAMTFVRMIKLAHA